jgi:hypothetical protein
MFSAIGTVAVTATGSSSRAASTVVATTAAAPLMSDVMWSMLAAGLIEMPPVSNVMPLPTRATEARGESPPDQRSRTSRGLREEPWPTPSTPPYPAAASAASSSTSTSRPAAPASSTARAANDAGNRSFGGVLTRSRAVLTASATATAVRTVASASPVSAPSSAIEPTGSLRAPPLPLR